jgi:hypothetical protein
MVAACEGESLEKMVFRSVKSCAVQVVENQRYTFQRVIVQGSVAGHASWSTRARTI